MRGIIVRDFREQDYMRSLEEMRGFSERRGRETMDEIWMLEHSPVYTLGQSGDMSDLLGETEIPVIRSDRGGQITYHGPGQLVSYILIDLRRRGMGARRLVDIMQESVMKMLSDFGISSEVKSGAPGVYVKGAKISSLGLRIRRGCTYHGLSLNVEMDMSPFTLINPCGYRGQRVTQMSDLVKSPRLIEVQRMLSRRLKEGLGVGS